MPSSLFGLTSRGRVMQLSTSSSNWTELQYVGIEFKRISASQQCIWAIGADYQLYLYIIGSELPVRVKEISYENQRWNPIDGFCTRLLQTDRPRFSTMDGRQDRTRSSVQLPSLAWLWEDEWTIDLVLNGEPLQPDGWTYAVDFPATYYPRKYMTSCVRRRRWFRWRRYAAVNTWTPIPGLSKDPTDEPILDVAVGGEELLGWDNGKCIVWAVTARGRVLFRNGVDTTNPEGTEWIHVETPQGWDVNHISCGLTGLTWAVTWDGKILVRNGMSHKVPHGIDWCVIAPPQQANVVQVSVGTDAVWVVTKDKRVYFRKGIRGYEVNENSMMACGTGWLEMDGEMSFVAVGLNNQVWALGIDKILYFRTNVSSSEHCGHTWRPVNAQLHSDDLSLGSRCSLIETTQDNARGAAGNNDHEELKNNTRKNVDSFISSQTVAGTASHVAAAVSGHHAPIVLSHAAPSHKVLSGSKSSLTSIDSDAESTASMHRLCIDEDNFHNIRLHCDEDIIWLWLTAGGCAVDVCHLPPWFSENHQSTTGTEVWRLSILEKVKERKEKMKNFSEYPQTVERTSWIKSSKCKWLTDEAHNTWVSAMVELEQSSSDQMGVESGTLSVYSDGHRSILMSLSEMLCCYETRVRLKRNVLCLYTSLNRHASIKLAFNLESELREWIDSVQMACLRERQIKEAPSAISVWAVTMLGDVFATDLKQTQSEVDLVADLRGFTSRRQLGVPKSSSGSCQYSSPLENGFTVGSSLTIKLNVIDNADRFHVNLQMGPSSAVKDCDVAFHFNPRINESLVVCNSSLNRLWGKEERQSTCNFQWGTCNEISIICESEHYRIVINEERTILFQHRTDYHRISHLEIVGDVILSSINYDSAQSSLAPSEMFWRQLGGHARMIETCRAGVVWYIGDDFIPWVYTGGTGGGYLTEYGGNGQLSQIKDVKYEYLYENQRWNPITGFSQLGLPTDRYSWSDSSGREERTKETIKLLSSDWKWIGGWSVDFHTPGGVDRDGWQYAVDFPASYHESKTMSDFVRRRRWYRKCQLTTTGPWQQLVGVKLLDLSMNYKDGRVLLWAVTISGDVIYRCDVTPETPTGTGWTTVATDQPFRSISVGDCGRRVWAIAKDGSARLRYGVNGDNATGNGWVHVDAPDGTSLKKVSAGQSAVWSLDSNHVLHHREEINNRIFPEGTSWRRVASGVSHVTCGDDDQLWVVMDTGGGGTLCRRLGVCPGSTRGSGWQHGPSANWMYVTARGGLDENQRNDMKWNENRDD